MYQVFESIKKYSPFIVVIIFIFSYQANGQIPEATPPDDIAEVVSRDIDNDKNISIKSNSEDKNKGSSDLEKKLEELLVRIKSLESSKGSNYDAEQKKLLLSLDILTKTEQRAENLRKQLIDLVEKETNIKTRLEAVEYNLRPEIISRSTAIYGSLRPEDIREQRKKNLESEKKNLENLLSQIQRNRENIEQSLKKADEWVEKVRLKFEKQIDKALEDESSKNQP